MSKKIKTVGVVGAGTMGSAIAQKFAQEGFTVILNDREESSLNKGISGIKEILWQGVTRGIFTHDKANEVLLRIIPVTDQNELKKCDLIVEAIFEDFKIKSELFSKLSSIVSEDVILATNTSSFSVSELAKSVSHPERFIGLHYFYHAAKNRLVEIIPGEKTSDETYRAMQVFSVMSGKDAITTRDVYGFAVNRFFVPWLNEAVKILDEKIASIEEIDTVCMKTFGIGMGPFALMNATGVPIALHAQKTLEHFGPSYKVSELLVKQVASKKDWTVEIPENFIVNAEKGKQISDRMLGCTFFVCGQILAEKICSATDLNRGAKIGLRWRKGPVDIMNESGLETVNKLINEYAERYGEKPQVKVTSEACVMEYVTLSVTKDIATVTMSKPEDMNALNEEVMKQLDSKFQEAEKNDAVKTIVLTGSGKAFVAGADIKFFVQNIKSSKIDRIIEFTSYGQRVFDKIENSSKKVVAVINGLALGGGLELALCADIIYALPKSKFAFPETGIGIYPGLGGTQRSAKRIGKGLAKYLILSGKMIGAKEAIEIGLVDKIIDTGEFFDIIQGTAQVQTSASKVQLNEKWKTLENLFTTTRYDKIISGDLNGAGIDKETASKLSSTLGSKAPVAMKFADVLIEEAKGNSSELEKLHDIFSTKDALLGLTSIGKKVEYSGT
ncbi:MAG: 3-hydroxyacyl-CoA dehydrogenase/enoyl-CoA hydratase family protein [Crocinitomicaceae bacterium]|nr:3-hydroxyacyl-CoA dehydrogenase/enoyl-CoA hydratase family protein [Crocinitomicaceae bacterium]